jgi:hypothetical protein
MKKNVVFKGTEKEIRKKWKAFVKKNSKMKIGG